MSDLRWLFLLLQIGLGGLFVGVLFFPFVRRALAWLLSRPLAAFDALLPDPIEPRFILPSEVWSVVDMTRVDDFDFVRQERRGTDYLQLRLSVQHPEGTALILRPRAEEPAAGIKTGDAAFDRLFFVAGPPLEAARMLTAPVRAHLVQLPHIEIGQGRILLSESWEGPADPLTRILVSVAERVFHPPKDIAQDLHDRLRTEPHGAIRRWLLSCLIETYPDDPRCQHALDRALDDPEPIVAWIAACRATSEPGFERYRQLLGARQIPFKDKIESLEWKLYTFDPDKSRGLLVHLAMTDALPELPKARPDDIDDPVHMLISSGALRPGVPRFTVMLRRALDAIRNEARAQKAGGLALVDDEGGALALAKAETGAVSMPTPDPQDRES